MNIDNQNIVVILAACLAVSEALSLIPAIKSNGIFQLVKNTLDSILKKKA